MREYVDQAAEPGVVVVVVAQEVQKVFMGYTRRCKTGSPQFGFEKADRRVTVYYLYILDPSFGLGFIKICSYFPYPPKMWVNGHEWAKRQAAAEGLAFTELANGFATPACRPSAIDSAPAKLQACFNYWDRPHPLPVHPNGSAGWVLVAAQHATGRGRPDHRARWTSRRARFL